MISKELRDGWWKFAAATLLVLIVVLAFPVPAQYEEIVKAYDPSTGPLEVAVQETFALYTAGGFFALVPLAALLGGTLVSSEVSGNTIYLLLSRPTSRWRLLLVKYTVCAAILLVAAVSGSVLLILIASSKGYPLGFLNTTGLMFSAGLMWLGSLFVLGIGLFISILLRSVLGSVLATVIAAYAVYALPLALTEFLLYAQDYSANLNYDLALKLTLFDYWSSESLFTGENLALTNFLVCTTTAVVPSLAALWLFNRRAY